MRSVRSRRDPAPSRFAYRMNRLMLTPSFRRFLRYVLPVLVIIATGAIWASDDGRREDVMDRVAELRRQIEARPEFRVSMMDVVGADAALEDEVRSLLALDFPMSSFDIDLAHLRAQVETLPAVLDAGALLKAGEILVIEVQPRNPVAVWRGPDGLRLVDETGQDFATLAFRSDRPDLPLIAGRGAAGRVTEALMLHRAAAPIHDRLRGFVRIGERRWDVVLDRGQRVMLPETGAVLALERTVALDAAQDLLSRDVTRVDFRNPDRPVLRLGETAAAGPQLGDGDG